RPNQPKVVVVSEGIWRRKLGGDPHAIGRTIQIDGVSHEVIGVMPSTFRFPTERTQLWMPIAFDEAHVQVGGFNYTTIARLQPGATREQALVDLTTTMGRLPDLYPEVAPGLSTRAMMEKGHPSMMVHALRDDVVGDVGRVLWVVLGTIGFVLLVAC